MFRKPTGVRDHKNNEIQKENHREITKNLELCQNNWCEMKHTRQMHYGMQILHFIFKFDTQFQNPGNVNGMMLYHILFALHRVLFYFKFKVGEKCDGMEMERV